MEVVNLLSRELKALTKLASNLGVMLGHYVDLDWKDSVHIYAEGGVIDINNFTINAELSMKDAETATADLDKVFVNKHLSTEKGIVFTTCRNKAHMQIYYDNCTKVALEKSLREHYLELNKSNIISDVVLCELSKKLSEEIANNPCIIA